MRVGFGGTIERQCGRGFTQRHFTIGATVITFAARQPEGPARVLLSMLARDPGIVARVLS
ncbi:MAG: hypothetical protein AABY88_08070 [Pseudomonadota bacterium]